MKNEPHQILAMQRTTHKASCPDYNRARQVLLEACATHEFVWLEAYPNHVTAATKTFSTSGFVYAVHASADGKDVPDFSIEVYEKGVLCRYETERQKIIDFAAINEDDRITLIRSQDAKAALENKPIPFCRQTAFQP